MGSECNHKGPYKREAEGEAIQTEVRVMLFEDGQRDHEPRNVGSLWQLKKVKTKKWILPWSLQKEPALLTP